MDFNTAKFELLDKFKEHEVEIEELSRIEESQLLQSPKFKRMQSLSPPKSPPLSPSSKRPSCASNSSSKNNNENSNIFESMSIPRLRYRPSNPLLKTPTKPKRNTPLKPLNQQLPINFNATSPTKIKNTQVHKVSLTPAQRLEKRPGKLLTTSDILASYEFKETVGRGAFANVYRAINKVTGDEVAIKEIFIEDDDDILELMSEIDLLKILKHKNIVKYHGFIRNEKKLLIFLEYCSGGSLRTLYKKSGPLSEKVVIGLLRQVLNGLIYLHDQGVVHRDVKAANILLTDKGDIKLTDFGVSTKVSNNTIKTFSIAGTPNWMAPEIISMDGTSTASDIWSLGATVVELLTGEPLYCHLNEMAALHAIVMDSNPPIPQFVSPGCRDFLLKCFEKIPTNRSNAKDLLEHHWLQDTHARIPDATLYCSLNKRKQEKDHIEIRRDFNSIKRFNTKNFLPLEITTFKQTQINEFISSDLSDDFNELVLDDAKYSTSKFDPIRASTSDEFDLLEQKLYSNPHKIETLSSLGNLLKAQKMQAGRFFKDNCIFKLLQWIEAKYSSDSELLLEYLKILHTVLENVDEASQEFIDLAGLPLISKFFHNKYENSVRLQTMDILQLLFSKDDSNICLFIQIGSLKAALKLLQEDYEAEKRFTLFVIEILHTAFTKSLIPERRLQSLLSNYTNFMDWMAVVLMQFVKFDDADGINMTIKIVSKFRNSKILTIRPVFLNSIFKVFDKLTIINQRLIMKFLKSVNINEIPENTNFLKFLVKTLKKCSASKSFDNEILNTTCSIIFSICHLNQEQQYELVKLDVLPTFQTLISSTLPCSEYIIPLICEFAFNTQLTPTLLKEENILLQDYLELLVDPIWQANALDSILALHELSNDGKVSKMLLDDGSKLLIHSFLVEDTLNYELYLEKLIKLLNSYNKSITINQIRLDLFQNIDVIDAVFKRIEKYGSDLVIHINLLKLLKVMVANNYEHQNYHKVMNKMIAFKGSGILLVDRLVQEILEVESSKEKSMMKPPLNFKSSTLQLKAKNLKK